MATYNFSHCVKNITADTYLLSGTKDSDYRKENNKKLYDLLTCKKGLKFLKGVPHDMANTPEHKQELEKALDDIFNNKLFLRG